MSTSSVNVQVAVRCRPMNKKETQRGCKNIVTINENLIHIEDPEIDSGASKNPKSDYTYDFVYNESSTQDQVYHDLGMSMVTKALDGFNGTIFAYGQTGSGKMK
jgi:hypothetical protein